MEDCKKNLHKLNHIIFLDDSKIFEKGISELFQKLGKKNPYRIVPTKNKRKKSFPISNEEIEKLKELNSLDIALYKYAKKHFYE